MLNFGVWAEFFDALNFFLVVAWFKIVMKLYGDGHICEKIY